MHNGVREGKINDGSADYSALLDALLACGRPFSSFAVPQPRGMLLRLDVDYDMGFAAQTARANSAKGVRATYFVRVDARLYNVLESASLVALREIVAAGQDVGLHFHNPDGTLDAARLKREFAVLQAVVPEALRVVAWHNPEGDLAPLNEAANRLGFASAYDRAYGFQDAYFSDSNARLTPEEIVDKTRESNASVVQVLLHPFYWMSGGSAPTGSLLAAFRRKADELMAEFAVNRVWRERLAADVELETRASRWYRGK
jgi:hypothetical protein